MFTQDVFTTHDVFTKIHQSSATSPLNNHYHDHYNHQDNHKQDHDQYTQDSHLGNLTAPPLQHLLSTTMTIIIIKIIRSKIRTKIIMTNIIRIATLVI